MNGPAQPPVAEVDGESAAIAGTAGPGGARQLDRSFRRNLILVAGIVLFAALVIGYLAMSRGKAPVQQVASTLPSGVSTKDNQNLPPPNVREKLLDVQQNESEVARARGQSYVPPDVLIERGRGEATNTSAARAVGVQVAPTAHQADPRDATRLQAAERLIQGRGVIAEPERVALQDKGAPAAEARSPATAPTPAVQLATTSADVVVDAMEIFGARLSSPIDTDLTNYVSAEITTGRLAGAFLIGSTSITGEGMNVTFTAMRHAGRSYPINAIALDMQTSTNAVAGNVDRKILQRYVFPVAMAFAGAYATAKAQPSRTLVGISVPSTGIGGTTTGSVDGYGITQPSPTTEQARAAGVAAAVGIGQREVNKLANEPIRVTMAAGTPIGIIFRNSVSPQPQNGPNPAAPSTTGGGGRTDPPVVTAQPGVQR